MLSSSSVDAVSRLPFELSSHIFIYCLSNQLNAPSIKYAPLLLCHICSSWRSIALRIPYLWSTLFFKFSEEGDLIDHLVYGIPSAANLASLWFENIGNSALSLSLHWYASPEILPLEDVIVQNSNRLRKLNLYFSLDIKFSRFFTLSPGNMKHLEYLSLHVRDIDSKLATMSVFQSAPRLRKVLINQFYETWMNTSSLNQPLPWSQLTHLDIRDRVPFTVWRVLLRQCTSLERCAIEADFDPVQSDASVADRLVTTLPNMVDLTVCATGDEMSELDGWLRSLRFPMLEELELQFTKFTPVNVNVLHITFPLSSLQRLALINTVIDTESIVALVCATTSLTELALWLMPDPSASPDIRPLLAALTCPSNETSYCVLPRLKILELWLTFFDEDQETVPACVAVVESRWRAVPCNVAHLDRVALHFRNWQGRRVKEAELLLRCDTFDGLDVRVDEEVFPGDRSDRW